MPAVHARRHFIRSSLALGASLMVPAARACEFFAPNLRITHPWTRATPQDAAYAIVCMKFDEVTQDDSLIGIETPVAATAMLVTAGSDAARDFGHFEIPAGHTTLLSEAGVHLRLIGLRQPLEVACTYPMRLIFAKGGSVNADLSVDYARFL